MTMSLNYTLLYRHKCFTGKYTTRIIHIIKNWIIGLNAIREFSLA